MVLRTAIAALCLALPAAAAGQVTYAEDRTLVTTGAAELLYLIDAEGDGDLDVWAGPKTDGVAPIDLHEASGGAFIPHALTMPTATYIHWAPCLGNAGALQDICYGDSAVVRIYYTLSTVVGTLGATSSGPVPNGALVLALRPMELTAVIGGQLAYVTSANELEAADPAGATVTSAPLSVGAVLDVRAGDVDGDGNDDVIGLRAGDVQLVVSDAGVLGAWFSPQTIAIAGAVDATVADLDGLASRELVVVTNLGTAYLVNDAAGAGTVTQLALVQDAVAVTTLDADLDGDLDLAFAVRPGGLGAGIAVWLSDGVGGFVSQGPVATGVGTDVPTAIAAGELGGGDEKPELALALGGATHEVVIFAAGNIPPQIAAAGALPSPVPEGQSVTLSVSASAPELGQALSYQFFDDSGVSLTGGVFSASPTLVVTAPRICGPNLGATQDFTYGVDVFDGIAVSSRTITLTVSEAQNDLPSLDSFPLPATIPEFGTTSVTAIAHDDCSNPLTYVFTVTAPLLGGANAAIPAQLDLTGGQVCGPTNGAVRLQLFDADGGSYDSGDTTVGITEVRNDAPVVGAITPLGPLVEGSVTTFSVVPHSDDCTDPLSYNWQVPGGLSVVSGTGTDQLTVMADPICGNQTVDLAVDVRDVGNPAIHLTLSAQVQENLLDPPTISAIAGPGSIPEGTSGAGPFRVSVSDLDCPGTPPVAWTVTGDATIASGDGTDTVFLDALNLCAAGGADLSATVTGGQGTPVGPVPHHVDITWTNAPPGLVAGAPTGPAQLLESGPAVPDVPFDVIAADDCTPPPLAYAWSATPDLLDFALPAGAQTTATVRQPLCGTQTVDVAVEVSDLVQPSTFAAPQVLLIDDLPSSPVFPAAPIATLPAPLAELQPATIRVRIDDALCPVTGAPPIALTCDAYLRGSVPPVRVGTCTVEQEIADPLIGSAVIALALPDLCPTAVLSFDLSLSGPFATSPPSLPVDLPVAAGDDPPTLSPGPPTASAQLGTDPLVLDLLAPVVTDDGCTGLTYTWAVVPAGRLTIDPFAASTAVAHNVLDAGAAAALGCLTTAGVEVSVQDGGGVMMTSTQLSLTVPSLDFQPPLNARFVEQAPQSVEVDAPPLPLHVLAEDECPANLSFRFSTTSSLVTLDGEGSTVAVSAVACNPGGTAEIVATPTDGVQDGTPATLEIDVVAGPVTLQPPPPLILALDGTAIDAGVTVTASCPIDLCFAPDPGQPAAPLHTEAGDECGGPDRHLRIAAEDLAAFLPPHDRLSYTVGTPPGATNPADPVKVEVQLVPTADLLTLDHSTDRGRLGPGETATLTVEIASRLLGPIQVPVVIEDSLLGLRFVEGTAQVNGATLVEATSIAGGAEFTVTNLPAAGGTATLTFLVSRSLASDGVVTSRVIARAVDRAPLSHRDGTAAAGPDLATAPGISCSCASGGTEGSAWTLGGLLFLALLTASRNRPPPRSSRG